MNCLCCNDPRDRFHDKTGLYDGRRIFSPRLAVPVVDHLKNTGEERNTKFLANRILNYKLLVPIVVPGDGKKNKGSTGVPEVKLSIFENK